MCQESLRMKDVLDLFRQKFELGFSDRRIAKSLGLSKTTVANYLQRFVTAGLSWPLAADLDHLAIRKILFPAGPLQKPLARFAVPDWAYLHQELKRDCVTLTTLWEEYREALADDAKGYSYSQYCDLYRRWAKTLAISMRQHHVAGDKMFVDYSGKKIDIMVNAATGEMRSCEIFVAVLGASGYTYAEATWSQTSTDWIHSHVRAFEFFGGVTNTVVPDNLKSAVIKPDLYDPTLNRAYQEMASYYGTAIMPARVRRPKDKPKAEIGVRLAQIWILAKLRNRIFVSLAELNAAIRELLSKLNLKPMQKIKKSRREFFEAYDLPALKPLPNQRYAYAEFKTCRPNVDYHAEVEEHYYSVPFQLRGLLVEARYNDRIVEFYHHGKRVASHRRKYEPNKFTTLPEHMPSSHRHHAEWSPSRIINWGESVAFEVGEVCRQLIESYKHPEHGYRGCLGIMRQEKKFGRDRLISACKRALVLKSPRYATVVKILKSGTDKLPLPGNQQQLPGVMATSRHDNIRGGDYYNQGENHDHRGNDQQTHADENARHGEINQREAHPSGSSGLEPSGDALADRGRRVALPGEPQDESASQSREVQDPSYDGSHRLPNQERAREK